MLDNISNQTSKIRTKNWVEINDDSRGAYDTNSQMKFKTTMLKSRLCDHSDTEIMLKILIMSMNNLIEYSDNYSKTSGSLWQYFRDEPNVNLADSESFKSKIKKTGKTPAGGNTKDV